MGKNEAGCEGCCSADFFQDNTLPETEIAPENRPSQKETSIFRGELLVSGSVNNCRCLVKGLNRFDS